MSAPGVSAGTTAQVAAALAESVGGVPSESFGQWTVDVPAQQWVPALTFARDDLGLTFFDWLSAVDELAEGFSVVCHLADPVSHAHLLVRTQVAPVSPSVATVTGVFRGASWHERETHEMFGIDFTGHPDLRPLLLPDGFEGQPLRKDFVLAARAAKPWPGAKEPGESDRDIGDAGAAGGAGRAGGAGGRVPTRRRTLPPGVPDPAVWGPRPPGATDGPAVEDSE